MRQAHTYAALIKDLEDGRVQAAWAPPLVCAHLENRGGRMLLRCRRHGAAGYRAALYCRVERKPSLEGLKGARAVWPDAQSMSGFLLPRAVLRANGLVPDTLLGEQRFLGSHAACAQAVLDGKADLSSVYATSEGVEPMRFGLQTLVPARAGELRVLAFSADCPNDGVVLSPRVTGREADEFAEEFADLASRSIPGAQLASALEVQGFDVPPPGTFERLLDVMANPSAPLVDLMGPA